MYMYLRGELVYFTSIFVKLFVRWRHQLWPSLRNWNCFYLWPYYLDDLTFWRQNGATSYPCHGLPSCYFQLATPFHSRLRVRHGQTDRQTDDGHQCIMPPSCGDGAWYVAIVYSRYILLAVSELRSILRFSRTCFHAFIVTIASWDTAVLP